MAINIVLPKDPEGDDTIQIPFAGVISCLGSAPQVDPMNIMASFTSEQDDTAADVTRISDDVIKLLKKDAPRLNIDWGFRFDFQDTDFYPHGGVLAIIGPDGMVADSLTILWSRRHKKKIQPLAPTASITSPTDGATGVPRNVFCYGTFTPNNATVVGSISNPKLNTPAIMGTPMVSQPGQFMLQFIVPSTWGDNTQFSSVVIQVTDSGGYSDIAVSHIKFST